MKENDYKETFETWNEVASLYEEKFMDLELYNGSYNLICDLIPKVNAKLLDLGCGPGNITKYLLSKRPDFKILGIDIAPNMIALAKKNNPSAEFSVMDSRDINLLTTKFDGIICGFCLPYLSVLDIEKLLMSAFNLLDEHGLLYLSFVEGRLKQSGFKKGSTGHRSYFYYHSLTQLKSIVTANSFEPMQVIKVDYKKSDTQQEVHTILFATKKSVKV